MHSEVIRVLSVERKTIFCRVWTIASRVRPKFHFNWELGNEFGHWEVALLVLLLLATFAAELCTYFFEFSSSFLPKRLYISPKYITQSGSSCSYGKALAHYNEKRVFKGFAVSASGVFSEVELHESKRNDHIKIVKISLLTWATTQHRQVVRKVLWPCTMWGLQQTLDC